MKTEYLVIGGGPTGLGAAARLAEKGRDWHLLEAESQFGGLASSFVDEAGFTWDLGGHVQFSHYDTFDAYMDRALGPDGWLTHQRESWIWIRDGPLVRDGYKVDCLSKSRRRVVVLRFRHTRR